MRITCIAAAFLCLFSGCKRPANSTSTLAVDEGLPPENSEYKEVFENIGESALDTSVLSAPEKERLQRVHHAIGPYIYAEPATAYTGYNSSQFNGDVYGESVAGRFEGITPEDYRIYYERMYREFAERDNSVQRVEGYVPRRVMQRRLSTFSTYFINTMFDPWQGAE